MGVRTSRWVTMHGLALNVSPDLSYFEKIVPCGISDKSVTSILAESGMKPDLNQVSEKFIRHFESIFEVRQ